VRGVGVVWQKSTPPRRAMDSAAAEAPKDEKRRHDDAGLQRCARLSIRAGAAASALRAYRERIMIFREAERAYSGAAGACALLSVERCRALLYDSACLCSDCRHCFAVELVVDDTASYMRRLFD